MRALVLTAVVSALLATVCIVTIDEPAARWLAARDTWPALWNQGIALLEYPLGIEPYKWTGIYLLVAGSLATLVVHRWRPYAHVFLLVTLVHLLGRNLSFYLKVLTGRLRPEQWLERGGDTFFRDGGYSFPSGHAILFASIVVPLVVVYPRLRPLLAVVAFAMAARVAVNAHFLSDVLAGLALTALVTWACARLVRRAVPWPTPPGSRQ